MQRTNRTAAAPRGASAERFAAILALLLVCAPRPHATPEVQPKEELARFEEASVRRNNSNTDDGRFRIGGSEHVSLTNVPLRQLIGFAYGKRPFEVVGGPGWIDSQRYDITAKASERVSTRQVLPMLRALLSERFGLRLRADNLKRPVYVLMVASPETARSALVASSKDCPEAPAERQPEPVRATKAMLESPECEVRMAGAAGESGLSVRYADRTMNQFANDLSFRVDRVVRDGTDLAGRYTFALKFRGIVPPADLPSSLTADPPGSPNLFVALREQLGLALKADTADIAVLVVEKIEQPKEN